MIDRWQRAGAQVDIVAYGGRAGARREGAWGALATAAELVAWGRRLPRPGPDQVLIANSLPAGLALSLASGRRPGPVWAIHDRLDAAYLGPVAARATSWALRRWSGPVVVNSAGTARTLPPGVVASVIPPASAPLAPARPDEGGPTTVAVVGRIAPWKGQHVAIEAFARAFAGGPQRLLLVGGPLFGEDAYHREVLERCRRPDIGPQVEVLGHVADVASAVARAAVLVHSSTLAEPFGRVLVEGLSAGLAVVASDGPSTRHILDGGRHGLLVPPGSVDDLAAALDRLDTDPAQRRRLAAGGPERASAFAPAVAAVLWRRLLVAQGAMR
jgi:glycosyltransferase involved in cell wall biosynthesis